MIEHARVTSIEAIESFRASLIIYLERVRPTLEEANTDLRRVRLWLETDQRLHWERQVQRRSRQMEEAKQNLFSARMATFRVTTASEEAAVHKARQALSEAEEKLAKVRKWAREFDHRTEALVRQLNSLDGFLSQDMGRAVAWLTQAVGSLDAYANLSAKEMHGFTSGGKGEAPPPAESGGGQEASDTTPVVDDPGPETEANPSQRPPAPPGS